MCGGDEFCMNMFNGREKLDEFLGQSTWRSICLEEESLVECRSADFFGYQGYHRWAAINLQCETAKIENEAGDPCAKYLEGDFS